MNIIKLHSEKLLLIGLMILYVTGCSLTHKYDSKKFGSSVRTMVNSQIYDRSTIKNPPLDVVQGMDSEKAISDVRKVYRKSEGNKQQLKVITPVGGK